MNPLRHALWLIPDGDPADPVLIRRFYIGSMPIQSQFYFAGPVNAEIYINKKSLTDRLTYTDEYCSADITSLLIAGENILAIRPGKGSPRIRYSLELDCKRLFSDESESWLSDSP